MAMYCPYFRGKQFELLAIRESAKLLARSGFVPIIEPVRESLGGLKRTLKEVRSAGGSAIVVINPYHGDHRENGTGISALLEEGHVGNESIAAGVLLKKDMSLRDAMRYYEAHKGQPTVLLHAGFIEGKSLADALGNELPNVQQVFFGDHTGRLYRKHFERSPRVLLHDGFKRQRNADYPEVEEFSELHVTFEEDGFAGFGDFLIVGDDYSEGGGPAYAVAIHLTFIDPSKDDAMFIYHFVSTTKGTPTDPAGKFGEALKKLVAKLDSGESQLYDTEAIREFRELNAKGHFPGLGYVKKLSMKHHIETLHRYFAA